MTNTRADLERLKHHWEHDDVVDPEVVDELLAMTERLLFGVYALSLLYEPGQGGPVDRHALALDFRALLNPEGSNDDRSRACLRCGWTGPGHELRTHLATCE